MVADIVGRAILEESTALFLRAAWNGNEVPIEVTLPEGATSSRWQAFLDHLMRAYRGRALQTPDNFKYIINVSPLTMTRDTIRVIVDAGIRSRCRGAWISDGMSHQVTWVRHGDSNDWKRLQPGMRIAYDSFGCPVDPR